MYCEDAIFVISVAYKIPSLLTQLQQDTRGSIMDISVTPHLWLLC